MSDVIRVDIGLTMNTAGEWVAYGDNQPSQNTWHNSARYRIVADVPRPTRVQVSGVCHPCDGAIMRALHTIAKMEVPPNDADPNTIQAAVYRARSVAREVLGVEDV